MIFQIDFFNWVAQSAGVMVFISAFIALTWLGYERKRRGLSHEKKLPEKEKIRNLTFHDFLKYYHI